MIDSIPLTLPLNYWRKAVIDSQQWDFNQPTELRMKKLLPPVLVFGLLISQWSFAQTQEAQNLYQVEVIIFERLQRSDGSDQEIWPKTLDLSYPKNWSPLTDPKQAAQKRAQAEQGVNPETSFSLSPELLNSINADAGAVSQPLPSEQEYNPEFSNANGTIESDKTKNEELLLQYFLPEKFKQLNKTKDALDKRYGYRILFHNAWMQLLQASENAPALPIWGGNTYDEHRELEGYITLSLSRYLHIQTNLWLTEFVSNYGQAIEHWPTLPVLEPSSAMHEPATKDISNFSLSGTSFGTQNTLTDSWATQSSEPDPYAELLVAPYLIKNIATLKQKRRMRSGELHYIDHPKMGVLIKVEPLTSQSAIAISQEVAKTEKL